MNFSFKVVPICPVGVRRSCAQEHQWPILFARWLWPDSERLPLLFSRRLSARALLLHLLRLRLFFQVGRLWSASGPDSKPRFVYDSSVTIHWKAKNNHFRFSLSLFTFFTLRLFLEKWKSDFFTFFTFTIAFEKWFFHFFHFHFLFWKVKKSLFHFSRKSLIVKKVKSESDYFSRSNVCL